MATDRQYERVARRLDGEDIRLGPAECALAEEIRSAEASLLALDAGPSAVSSERLRRRLEEYVALDSAQREQVEQIARDEAIVGPLLDVEAPMRVRQRVRRRLAAKLAAPRLRLRRAIETAAVAAAAAVFLVVMLWQDSPGPVIGPGKSPVLAGSTGTGAVIYFLEPPQGPTDPEIALLIREVDRLGSEIMIGPVPPSADDLELESLRHEVDGFWSGEEIEANGFAPSS